MKRSESNVERHILLKQSKYLEKYFQLQDAKAPKYYFKERIGELWKTIIFTQEIF